MKRVLNTLEILDRYNFNRADSTSSIDSLYSKIFADSIKTGGQVRVNAEEFFTFVDVKGEAVARRIKRWSPKREIRVRKLAKLPCCVLGQSNFPKRFP